MSISIINPVNAAGTPVDVALNPMNPGIQTGTLCKLNGDVLPPAGYYFDGIYFRMARGTETFTNRQVVDSPHVFLSKQTLYGTNPTTLKVCWDLSRDTRLQADCGLAPNEKPNTLYAVSRSFNYTPMNPSTPYQENLESATSSFKGRQTGSTTTASSPTPGPTPAPMPRSLESPQARKGAKAAPSNLELPVAAPPVAVEFCAIQDCIPARPGRKHGVDVGPDNVDGPWILYGGLSVTNHYMGNRLCRNGKPLRARILAIAAARVDWSISVPAHETGTPALRRAIRRPVGDMSIEPFYPSPWHFPHSPMHSIVAYQNFSGSPHQVLMSTDRNSPDILQFENDQDIYLQVNCLSFMQSTAAGSFDLWVKVID